MNSLWIFVFELAICLIPSIAIAVSLQAVLGPLLLELCAGEKRAAFWNRFTLLMLLIAPLLPVLLASHSLDTPPPPQLKVFKETLWYTLSGQFAGLLVIGQVIRRYIHITPVEPPQITTGE